MSATSGSLPSSPATLEAPTSPIDSPSPPAAPNFLPFPIRLNRITIMGIARPHLDLIDKLTLDRLNGGVRPDPAAVRAALASLIALVGPLPHQNMEALHFCCEETEDAILSNRDAARHTTVNGMTVAGFWPLEERLFTPETYPVFKSRIHEALHSAEEGVVMRAVEGHNAFLEEWGVAGKVVQVGGGGEVEGEQGEEVGGGGEGEDEGGGDEGDEGGDGGGEEGEEGGEGEEEGGDEEWGGSDGGHTLVESESDAEEEAPAVQEAVGVVTVREGVLVPFYPTYHGEGRTMWVDGFYDRLRMGNLWSVAEEVQFNWDP
ncbi:hypothetical protein QBC39DRAFT_395711 [Podospora conica]|nr:hypothetical protein QBC39DRAFT_395711 [Schizothecium conicum]